MLVDQLFISGSWVDSSLRLLNSVGTSVSVAAVNDPSELIADVYTGVFTALDTVTISTQSEHNPYNTLVLSVVTDGTTPNYNLIPGVAVTFEASPINGDTFIIHVGHFGGQFSADSIAADTPSSGLRHRVLNNGTAPVYQCKVRLLTQTIKFAAKVFSGMSSFSESAVEKTDPVTDQLLAYVIQASAVSGVGMSKIATLTVDGIALFNGYVENILTGDITSGTGLKADGVTPYRILNGPLKSLEFMIDTGVVDTDTAYILVFPSRFIQTAQDVSGVAGTYQVADLDLGDIQPGEFAYFWSRNIVPVGSNHNANPYLCNIALQGLENESTSAQWGT